jgi:hypothetical protein
MEKPKNKPATSKEEKYFSVSLAILKHILEKGFTDLNVSRVAKTSKVSRAWIYQYLGANKEDLLKAASVHLSQYFSRSEYTLPKTRAEFISQIYDGNEFVFQVAQKEPMFVQAYFKFKGMDNSLGLVVSEYENLWKKSYRGSFMGFFGFTKAKASLYLNQILILRMGYAHLIVVSKDKTQAYNESKSGFELFLKNTLQENESPLQ